MLYLVRGLPGSGKTTYAKTLNCFHLEADMYMMENGQYCYDHSRVGLAHDWCYQQACQAIDEGMDVVVSNTFIKLKFMIPYIQYAREHDCPISIKEMSGDYGNIHNVPEEVMESMKKAWEPLPDNFLNHAGL